MTDDVILDVQGLKKYYQSDTGLFARILGRSEPIRAVDGVDLEVKQGEVFGIVGESGSGKSTLGEVILRLEEPTEGRILFKGEDVTEFDKKRLNRLRQECQIIFQDPYETINPHQTILQAVSEPLRNFFDYSRPEMVERVSAMLEDVGLRPASNFLEMYPSQLSGGQRQRVNIARALILEPDLLIADEPVSMLDVSIQAGILRILEEMRNELGFSMLLISHNLSVVNLVSDRIGVMYMGKVVEQGDAREVIHDPMHPYTRALIDSLPDLDGERERVALPDRSEEGGDRPTGCNFHPRCPDEMPECSMRTPTLAEADGREVACFLHHDVVEDEEAPPVDAATR